MTQNLRDHFDRAVSDDPGAALNEMADAAITEGGRLRRRRNHRTALGAAAGVVAVIGAVAGLNLTAGSPESTDPQVTLAAAMMPVSAPSCLPQPVETDATDALVFLTAGVTEVQRTALAEALSDDPRVSAFAFESRKEAYEKFRSRYADNPDLIAAVGTDRFPEAFRLRLGVAQQYTELRLHYAAMDGVDLITGRRCTADAPVGGVL
ncbi:permease-like cell division protein FtsX [Actinoplanes sp. GCM10030250]|uniref:permease-like cell division protein FtsX n=1 Tax=Actinoplanes sp. GCM10030250 TaxID=3273376 RepID=UPI003614F189